MNIASTCHYSCQTDLTLFPKRNLFLHLLLLVQFTTGFQLKGWCCGSLDSQKGRRTKVLLQKNQKSCNILCSLWVPLSRKARGFQSRTLLCWNWYREQSKKRRTWIDYNLFVLPLMLSSWSMSIVRKYFSEPILPLFQLVHCTESIISPLIFIIWKYLSDNLSKSFLRWSLLVLILQV